MGHLKLTSKDVENLTNAHAQTKAYYQAIVDADELVKAGDVAELNKRIGAKEYVCNEEGDTSVSCWELSGLRKIEQCYKSKQMFLTAVSDTRAAKSQYGENSELKAGLSAIYQLGYTSTVANCENIVKSADIYLKSVGFVIDDILESNK